MLVALVVVGLAACDDPNGPSTPEVATVVITSVPSAALHVGGTAQLIVATLSSTGAIVNGAPVSWTSSDEGVATVSGGGVVTARGAGQTTVVATSGSGSASTEIIVVAPLTLNLAGGTVGLPDGSLTLSIPPGNGSGTVTFLVGPGAPTLADDQVVPRTIYQVSAESGSVGRITGSTITLRYDPSLLPVGVAASGLQLYRRSSSGWTPVRGSTSDPARREVTGTFSGAGIYAVRFTPVDRVILTGAQVDGALYAGQTTLLRAAALTAAGDTLSGRTVTWSTSAPAVATVDAQGAVKARSVGTATITATVEGATAATQVEVLNRPLASWNGVSDWTTFRGNNRRTGFVDATLDPVTFTRRWEVALGAAGALNEPATGNGNVYVSSNSYFGGQALWALTASTGATRWTRTFGSIHSVNGPATGNDRVYVSTGGHQDSFLWSFDAADGTVRFRSAYGNQWSRWLAPAVTDDIVYLGGGYYGGMSAFDAREGTELWRKNLPQQDGWTPAADADKAYAFGSDGGGHGLLAIDGGTGTSTVVSPNRGLPSHGTPVLGGGNDVFFTGGGRVMALDLTRGAVMWERPGSYQGVPAVDSTTVYAVVNGQVEARARADGAILWTWVPQSGTAASGSVIVTRNLLFVRLVPSGYSSNGGRVVALDLGARKIVWSYEADGEIALGDGLLLIASRSGAKVTAISVR